MGRGAPIWEGGDPCTFTRFCAVVAFREAPLRLFGLAQRAEGVSGLLLPVGWRLLLVAGVAIKESFLDWWKWPTWSLWGIAGTLYTYALLSASWDRHRASERKLLGLEQALTESRTAASRWRRDASRQSQHVKVGQIRQMLNDALAERAAIADGFSVDPKRYAAQFSRWFARFSSLVLVAVDEPARRNELLFAGKSHDAVASTGELEQIAMNLTQEALNLDFTPPRGGWGVWPQAEDIQARVVHGPIEPPRTGEGSR